MTLNEYAAKQRLELYAELQGSRRPTQGTFDEEMLKRALATGRSPQMGITRYEAHAIHFEFIYPDPLGSTVVLVVTVTPPERIVYMPVPPWVVESIWQGEINGSPHFESDAERMLEEFRASLSPESNAAEFDARTKVSREG